MKLAESRLIGLDPEPDLDNANVGRHRNRSRVVYAVGKVLSVSFHCGLGRCIFGLVCLPFCMRDKAEFVGEKQ